MKLNSLLFPALLLLTTGSTANAVTWNVTSAADVNVAGTLRFAVNNAAANDTIKFDPGLAGQTIALSLGELPITRNLTIVGPGPTNLAVVNASGRVFHVLGGPLNASILGLKLTGYLKGLRGVDGSFVSRNGAAGQSVAGGCILNEVNCVLTVSNCFFANCQAIGGDGGDGYVNGIYGFTAHGGNGGDAVGAAICNNLGDLFLMNSTFAANYAGGGHGGTGSYGGNGGRGGVAEGGGLASVYGSTDVYVVNSTFNGNTAAAGDGGNAGNAWALSLGAANGGNGGGGGNAEGGAIYVGQGCPLPDCTGIVHCTVDTNQVAPGQGQQGGSGVNGGASGAAGVNGSALGGGLFAPIVGHLPINNTIIAGNYPTFHFTTGALVISGPDVYHDVDSFRYNFIGVLDGSSGGWIAGFDFTGTVTAPLDPLLGPLQNNGGETLTQAPLPCSPVIDKGSTALFNRDQVGQLRPKGISPSPYLADGSDIGALELQSFSTHRPALDIAQAPNRVTISWPSSFNCFVLQQSSSIVPSNWEAVTNAVTTSASRCQVVISPLVGNRFYRLFHP